jgi:ferredoxin
MRVRVDLDRCQGHGLCEDVAPEVFEVRLDSRSHLVVPGGEVPSDSERAVDDAIAMCPEGALAWERDEDAPQ